MINPHYRVFKTLETDSLKFYTWSQDVASFDFGVVAERNFNSKLLMQKTTFHEKMIEGASNLTA